MKPSQMLNEVGQSPWLDLISRKLIHSGELLRFIEEDGIRGVTANPAIFEKAIVESDEYDEELSRLVAAGRAPMEIYETLAIGDVRAGCDVQRPLFDRLGGKDGFVSLEVSPFIARDTRATVEEAKRFWKAVDRPNLFIKIPANPEGIPAIREATAAGISVNITLIFSNRVYQQVIDAYMAGLEDRLAQGLPVAQIHSVASFFVSRVDTSVDKLLEQKGEKSLLGKIAVALEEVCRKLTDDGLKLFSTALENLLHAISARSEAQRFRKARKVDERLGRRKDAAEQGVKIAADKKVAVRLWAKDPSLWSSDPKHQEVAKHRLGWLDVRERMRPELPGLASFAKEAAQRFRHCVLLGM